MPKNPAHEFAKRVQKTPDGCWVWTGPVDIDRHGHRYGKFNSNSKRYHAARWAYERAFGPVSGFIVRRTCQTELCVNPDHHKTAVDDLPGILKKVS